MLCRSRQADFSDSVAHLACLFVRRDVNHGRNMDGSIHYAETSSQMSHDHSDKAPEPSRTWGVRDDILFEL